VTGLRRRRRRALLDGLVGGPRRRRRRALLDSLVACPRRRRRRALLDGLVAGAVAGVVSGAPSTVHAAVTGRPVLAATEAAGTILAPAARSRAVLLASAAVAHAGLSLGWGVVLAAALPRRRPAAWGALAGLAIAALDLGTVGRRRPAIRALPTVPQVADHVAYGAAVGAVLAARR
jgi:hypothetical protein